MSLREAISDYLKEFRGMRVSPEQIVIGAGTEYLYGLLIQLFGNQLVYAVENPGYRKIAKIYESMKVSCEYIDIDESGVCVPQLVEKGVDIVHISPSHHFPTGIVMPISRRYELLGWAAGEKDRYIIEDDYDSELRLSGKPIPTLQSIDVSGKVIYMNTFTKTLASTVRISYMILPQPLISEFYRRLSFYSCTVSNFEQYTLARFMKNGSFEKHINRLRNYYQSKRDAIFEAFSQSKIEKYISIQGEDAGVHFLMHVNTEKTEEEFMAQVKAKGVKLASLSEYYHNNSFAGHTNNYVMNYSSIDVGNVGKAVDILYSAVDDN